MYKDNEKEQLHKSVCPKEFHAFWIALDLNLNHSLFFVQE